MKTFRSARAAMISFAVFLSALVLCLQFDLFGRVSYAVEKGRLKADLDHLRQIDLAEVAALEQVSHAFTVIAEAAKPSVVYVEALTQDSNLNKHLEEIFGKNEFQPRPSTGTGSGVIIDESGFIVTNNHVVADADYVRVILADGRKFKADVVGLDPKTDVAVIKINADHLHPAVFADSDKVAVGNIVLAIGSPFRLGHSVSHGIISAMGRSRVEVGIDYQNWLQTDAPINPGNSGGPLINTRGEVVGINTAIATESGGNQGVGFAIPSNIVKLIAKQLQTGRKVVRGYLGVSIKDVDQAVAGAYGLDGPGGVLVEQVGSDSPAAKSGLKSEDIILTIDDLKLKSIEQLQELVALTPPETAVEMSIWRAGKTKKLSVTIGEQPDGFTTSGSLRGLNPRRSAPERDSNRDAENQPADRSRGRDRDDPISARDDEKIEHQARFDAIGLEAATVSPKLATRYRIDSDVLTGAVITRVDSTGEAFLADLRPGQVIVEADGRRINNIHELEQVLTDDVIARGVRMTLRVGSNENHVVLRVR